MKFRHSLGIAGAAVASVVVAVAIIAGGQPNVANAAADEPKVALGTEYVPKATLGTSLPEYDITDSYVSGVSAGGYMANQLHVAHSGVFEGAGIFAAGPYYCAEGDLNTALYACMDTFMARKSPGEFVQLTKDRAARGTVDPVENLAGDPVWLYHGTNDDTVAEAVSDDLATYYEMLG
ncbi:MAG: prolyl oligopeptidase family serine peptidase [Actinophytocola sp.]|nr:prolyl oligopeptidase family serine peptidase [Actinophytocola sp.]